MKRAPNHQCALCGKQYYACGNCDRINHWKAVTCTAEHYQIVLLFVAYARKEIDAQTFLKGLKDLNVKKTDVAQFTEGNRALYESAIAPSVAE